jgi:cytochrome c553
MKAYRDNDRGNSMMHKMSSNYSDEMIEAIATYYASHPAD